MRLVEFSTSTGGKIMVNADRIAMVKYYIASDETSGTEIWFSGEPGDVVIVEQPFSKVVSKLNSY